MSEITTALDQIKQHSPARQRYIDYYDGNHSLNFATEKFRSVFGDTLRTMRDNLCPIVVDAMSDRMEVINFASEDDRTTVADEAWKLWKSANMELISNYTHTEALKTGSAFLIVWPDEGGRARYYLQDSRNCAYVEDPETGRAMFAAKIWRTPDERLRLAMYYPDRTENYITANKYSAGNTELKETIFQPVAAEAERVIDNPFGQVPMFRFEASPILSNAIPIQDALNKTVCDKLVAMEFAAFRQRWATGLEMPNDPITDEPQIPFKAGADRIWFTPGKETKFGEFGAADLDQFLKVADSYRLEMARVSGTPLHFFSINTSDAISGEALKTLESRFTKRVWRHCLNFGTVWGRVMQFALTIENMRTPANITAQWQSPEHRSEKEFLETLGQKRDILDVPVDVLREEFGYTPEDIKKFNDFNNLIVDDTTDDTSPA